MAYSEGRDSIYEFSTAYSYAKFNLIALKSSPLKYISDLKWKRVIIQRNSIAETLLNASKCECERIYCISSIGALLSLKAGEADACVINSEVAEYYIERLRLKTLEVKQLSFGTLDNCYATYHGNGLLIREINRTLIEIYNDGTYNRIYKKWLTPIHLTFWDKYGLIISLICGAVIIILLICLTYNLFRLRKTSVTLEKSNKKLINSVAILNQIIQQIPMGYL